MHLVVFAFNCDPYSIWQFYHDFPCFGLWKPWINLCNNMKMMVGPFWPCVCCNYNARHTWTWVFSQAQPHFRGFLILSCSRSWLKMRDSRKDFKLPFLIILWQEMKKTIISLGDGGGVISCGPPKRLAKLFFKFEI